MVFLPQNFQPAMSKHPLRILAFFALMVSVLGSYAQETQPVLQWYSWSEGTAKAAKENKKILLYVYTATCGWCRKMENETFQNAKVAALARTDFVPVKLNAADNSELEFKGKTYRFVHSSGQRGYNALAAKMLDGRLSFPSIVFLDEAQDILQSFAGYKPVEEFLPIAVYYGGDYFKTMPWSAFQKKYESQH